MKLANIKMGIDDQIYYRTRNPKSKSPPVIKSHIKEIFSSVKDLFPKGFKKLSVLDVGSGQGEYCFEIEKMVKRVVGIEPFKPAYDESIRLKKRLKSKVVFKDSLIEDFKSKEKFDLVICLTVIEHMPNAEKSFKNIFSLMNKGGIIYLTAPNKLWPIESHYKLLFLSWLPISIANFYMRLMNKGDSYKNSSYSKTFFGMKIFFNKFSCKYEFILPKDPNGLFMGCGSGGKMYYLVKKMGMFLIEKIPIFWALSKGFILIIKKT